MSAALQMINFGLICFYIGFSQSCRQKVCSLAICSVFIALDYIIRVNQLLQAHQNKESYLHQKRIHNVQSLNIYHNNENIVLSQLRIGNIDYFDLESHYLQIDIKCRYNNKMYVDKIREAFQRKGFNSTSQINQNKFNEILDSLSNGEPYDKNVAEELWEQASGGSSIIQINSVCKTINDGIGILLVKLQEIAQRIKELERERAQVNASSGNSRSVLSKIENQIADLHQDREEFEQDLRLVTLPFGLNLMGRQSSQMGYDMSGSRASRQRQSLQQSGVDAGESQQLGYVLYLSIIMGIIEVIIIYGKFDFLNLMVVTCLLSIYLLNHFDNIYIKMSLILIAVSQVLDLIWLFMYAGQKWNPPTVGNDPLSQEQYLRFIVFFTVVVIGLKIPLGYFLFRIKNINDNKYVISMGLFKIILKTNKSNPITRSLAGSIQ